MRGKGVAGTFVALLLASCGGGSGQPAAQQSPPPEVTIATANNMLHTAEFVGVEKGFFLKHGVKVKLQVLNIGAEINKAMQSSSAQFGGGSITAIPTARQAGLNLTLFAPYMNSAITSTDDNALAVVARTDSGIKTGDWKSLVGKKIGLAVGGTGDEFVRAWMTKEGVGASQVTFLNVAPGNQLAVIQDKSVDAIASWEPYQSIIMTKLGSSVFLFQRGGGMLGYILGLETTDEYRQAHPDIVQKMADALVETEAWIRGHRNDAAVIATHWIPGLDVPSAEAAIQHLDFDPRISGCTVRAFADSTKVLVAQHKLKAEIPADQQVVSQYVDQAKKTEPQFFKDLPAIPGSCSA